MTAERTCGNCCFCKDAVYSPVCVMHGNKPVRRGDTAAEKKCGKHLFRKGAE